MRWILIFAGFAILIMILKYTESYDITPEQRESDARHCIIHKYPWEIKPNCERVDINNNCVKCIWDRDGVAPSDQYFVGINSITDVSAGCKFNNKSVSGTYGTNRYNNYPVWANLTGDSTLCNSAPGITTTNTSITKLGSNRPQTVTYSYMGTLNSNTLNTCEINYNTLNSLVDSKAITTIPGLAQSLEWGKVQKIDSASEPPLGGTVYQSN